MAIETTSILRRNEAGPIRVLAGLTAYTLLRVIVGTIMVAHGVQKLAGVEAFVGQVTAMGLPLPAVFARLAIAGELMGGAGLLVGLLTPIAAFGVLSVMLTAILGVHLPHGLFAQRGGYEYPLTLAGAALVFMLNGAGDFSVDAWLASGAKRIAWRRPTSASAPAPRDQDLSRPSGPMPSDGPVDRVTQAGMESFPASDPPAH